MSCYTSIPSDAVANVQAYSRINGRQRDDGHIARTPEELVTLVLSHAPADSVRVHVDTEFANRWREEREIEWLRTAPDRVFLYVAKVDTTEETYQDALAKGWTPETTKRENWASHRWEIRTWLGTRVSDGRALIGSRRSIGFGYHSYRRAVDCRIFGVRYVGWYMESSGDYCRLRKSKVQ